MPQQLRKRHKGHARSLKNLEERFVWYADGVEMEPASCKGRWLEAHGDGAQELWLDLGCGKGEFTAAWAALHPEALVVGLDYEKRCIAQAAQLACEADTGNLIFTLADAEDVRDLFAPGELTRIYLNFPTPHPRKKHATERLTYVDELVKYREILTCGGHVRFRTDSPMLWEFSLAQFELAGYAILDESRDLRADRPDIPESEYERKMTQRGAKVHAVCATPADLPVSMEQTVPLSLFEYLPEDLEAMEYVPYGMEAGVTNLRNVRAKQRARTQAQ